MSTSIRAQPAHGMNQHMHVHLVKGDNDMVSLLPSTRSLIMSAVMWRDDETASHRGNAHPVDPFS